MKNWKTTLVGVIGAIGLVVFQMISTGTLDAKTLIIAGVMAGVSALAKDHDVTGGAIVQASLPLADAVLSQVEKTNDSQLVKEIHTIVTGLASAQPAAPAAPAEMKIVS